MKTVTGLVFGIVVVAAAIGYSAGTYRAAVPKADTQGIEQRSKPEKKLLYYRNPMGLPDTSPVPKKDPMGMDYIAVYAGGADEESSNPIHISTQKIQKLGVRTEAAERRVLDKTLRAAGRIEPDERRMATIASKFEGYVERLHVNVTGQWVAKGQPLFEAYSPELVSAQREYLISVQGVASLKESDALAGMKQLAQSSLQRLKNWDISDEQIKALTQSGAAQRTLTFRSPATGVVMEKKAVQGMRFMPGEMLFQLADLSQVWVIADVFEQDLGLVKTGSRARITLNAYPGKTFFGTVTYVYPTLKTETRTVPVRVELANPGLLLKPGMFAQIEIQASAKEPVVTVPVSAVIDSGISQTVLIQRGEGRFEPRDVKLGARSDNYVEVIEGIREGDQVVVAANFLIDAESNLKAAITGFSGSPPSVADSDVPAIKVAVHQAQGTVEDVDMKAGTVSLAHGPIASLKWPAMTMEFKVANDELFKSLAPRSKVAVEFVQRQPGEWVITSVQPLATHTGH